MRKFVVIGYLLFFGAGLQAKDDPKSGIKMGFPLGNASEFTRFGPSMDAKMFCPISESPNFAEAIGFTNAAGSETDSLFVTSSGKKASVYKSLNMEYKHILNLEGSSATELYGATKFAVGELWADTDQVIESEVEGEFIKIKGNAMQIEMTFLGMSAVYDTRAEITFRFKDDKLMYQITNLEYYSPASEYSGASWTVVPDLRIVKNNGKPDEAGIQSIKNINVFIQDIESAIKKSVTESSDW